jgi:integrase
MDDHKANLTDRYIERLPLAAKGRYRVRDTELRGFFLQVGVRRKTFMVQGEYWKNGKRRSVKAALGQAEDMSAREARSLAMGKLSAILRGEIEEPARPAPPPPAGVTLRQAWDRYREAHLVRKERSPATIRGYRDHVERQLKSWLDTPLMVLGENPRMVADRHDDITRRSGKAAANGTMRTLRAIYNHARRTCRELPADNPTMGVDWNLERRRDTAMGLEDLPRWFEEAGRMRHPIRREFHLFTLLSGSRPGALMQARIEHLDVKRRVLHIPRPKGGAKRAFDIPLSRPMIRCLVRAIRAGRMMHPEQAKSWIFSADSHPGHLIEHKESRRRLFKWGNDLRQSYRTLGQAAGLSEIDMHLLMNHSLPGVNAGYITRAKLLGDHLRTAQARLSEFVLANCGVQTAAAGKRVWPFLPSRRIGDAVLDPIPPDPRKGVPQGPRHLRGRRVDDEPMQPELGLWDDAAAHAIHSG